MFHIVGCKIRNAGNVVIVDSFVLIVRVPETDSRSKSYGRLKILPSYQRVVRKQSENPMAKSPENLRGPYILLMSRFAPEITRRKPLPSPNDYIHPFKRARAEQFTGLWPDNVSYCRMQNPIASF